MLEIRSEENGSEVVIYIEGRMDTNSSPKVMEEVEKYVNTAQKIILDIEKVDYVSSAGLRVFVMADQQIIANGGELNVRNVANPIAEIFEMTGFNNMLTII
ncbi:MAG: STAS domain-containing protein [Eubacterium sp.]|nr:STAS domain-containing protein [Eubacterium sp.]MBQ7200231.1 STAS domain-containing protein [Eubacterium sp.]MBR0118542.1 STAS domain-containing protein [Eubacterium sp.]